MAGRALGAGKAGACVALLALTSAVPASAQDQADVWQDLPGDITELNLEDLLKTPVVESAARRKQSLDDAPAAVTQFTAQELLDAGVTTFADILRRVPGLFVLERRAKFIDVAMRGNYRVLLLIDGRLVSAADNSPFWEAVGLHPGEIERIEVMRGPSSIVFGSDGLSGVINIVTKRPLDHQGVEGLLGTGITVLPNQPADNAGRRVHGFGDGYSSWAVANAAQTLAARLTLSAGQAPDWVDLPATAPHIHGDFAFHGALACEWRPDANTTLFVDVRHVQNEDIQSIVGIPTPFYESHVVNALTVNFNRLSLLPNTNLMVIADAQREDLTDNAVDLDGVTVIHTEPSLTSVHALAQVDSSQLGGRNVVSLAGETSYIVMDHLLGDRAATAKLAAVLQNETVLLQAPRLVLGLGVRTERVSVSMQNHPSMSYPQVSPRVSLSISPSSKHIFRAVATSAYRTPDLFTTYMDVAVGESAGVEQLAIRSNPSVRPERALSAEVGYRAHPWRWLRTDVTGYLQQMHGRIDVLRMEIPVSAENVPDDWQSGIELGVQVVPRRGVGGYVSYGYAYTTHNSPAAYLGFPSQVLSVGANSRWRDFAFAADFHWFSTFTSNQLDVSQNGAIFNRLGSRPEPTLNLRIGQRILHDAAEVFVSARNVLALGRSYDRLAVLPSSWVQPSGATFMLGLRFPAR